MNFLRLRKVKPEDDLNGLPEQLTGSLSNGVKGAHETLSLMIRVANDLKGNPKIRRLAENILQYYQTTSHNHIDEARAIAMYVQEKVHYAYDPSGIEQVTHPLTLIDRIQRTGSTRGDCDDMALLCATLLLSIGIKPYFKVIRYSPKSKGFNHIYVVVYAKNYKKKAERIVLDCIIKDQGIGFEGKYHSGQEVSL